MPYTAEEKAEALALWTKHGSAETARRTGITGRTLTRWANAAGLMSQDNTQKTTDARAAATQRLTVHWADYRTQEATAAGSAATRLRRQVVEASDAQNANLLRARTIAYGVLIDKAELLSGQATERIEVWAESDVDRELREAIALMETRIHGETD